MIIMFVDRGSPERRNLDDLAPEADVREAKAPPDEAAVAEQRLDFLGRRIRRHIEVLGMQLKHGVTDATAHQERLVAGLVQSIQNLECTLGELCPGDVVGGAGNDSWFFRPVLRVLFQQCVHLEAIYAVV